MSSLSNASSLQLEALRSALLHIDRSCDKTERLRVDPIGIVRRFDHPLDRELVGLLSACLAFGNVKALRASILRVLAVLGPHIRGLLDDPHSARARLRHTGHRMVRGHDIAGLLLGARSVQRDYGSLGARFGELFRDSEGDLRTALALWTRQIRSRGGLVRAGARRGPAHVLPDPAKQSGCKRLLLFLRWMVRPDDGVDLGLWNRVPPAALVIPVDTHIHRLALNLGLTTIRSPSWRAAEQITSALRRIDPQDPVRFDFALCHLGMTTRCYSAQGTGCASCALRPACAVATGTGDSTLICADLRPACAVASDS